MSEIINGQEILQSLTALFLGSQSGKLPSGSTLDIQDSSGTSLFSIVEVSGLATFGGDVVLDATKKIYLDGGTDTYFSETSDNVVRLSVGGTTWEMSTILFGGTAGAGRATLRGVAPSSTVPVVCPKSTDLDTGLGWAGADLLSLIAGGAEGMRVDLDATAGNTRLLVYDVDNATLERVSVGAADSGGAGY